MTFVFSKPQAPLLSVIVVFYQMAREAPRTLFSLGGAYQSNIEYQDYEVIALDHGSNPPLSPKMVEGFGPNFFCRRVETDSSSPVEAINEAVAAAHGKHVLINIDGARILSPGILAAFANATRLFESAFVHTIGFHLGHGLQNETMLEGYNQAVEDQLLNQSGWMDDGYRLFDISVLNASCSGGFFSDIAESNCYGLPRSVFLQMGGLHPGFRAPGGGICNLDFYNRAMREPSLVGVRLLGEGSFHQFHGGVASNAPAPGHPWESFQAEYEEIYHRRWARLSDQDPVYLGRICPRARRFILSMDRAR
jgi:hypothetical protein